MDKLKNNKGITLIALIITVIVLLILAGVAINMVIGEDGLINKTSQSTEKYQEAQAKEELTMLLAGFYMEKMNNLSLDIGTYLSESEAVLKEEGTENYIIEYKRYEITVKKDKLEIVEVQKADGITPRIEVSEEKAIGKTTVKVKVTNYADFEDKSSVVIKVTRVSDGTVVLNKTASEEGNFEVTTKGKYNIEVTATSKSNNGGNISKIAKRENYEVAVTSAVSSIDVKDIKLEIEENKKLEITTVPSEDIEELTYTSSDTNIATVDEHGKVTGVAVGEATITVRGKTTTRVSSSCKVTVTKKSMTVTPEQIAAEPKKYYGAKVTNYTKGDTGIEWRIFYVDTENGNDGKGKYGDGKYTVYLIAKYSDSRTAALGSSSSSLYEYTPSTTKIREMNPTWATNRGTVESSWNYNEKAAAYLCDASKWEPYYDSAKANYAIGSPSVEMYVDSYNQTHSADSLCYRYQTDYVPGYGIGANGSYVNNGHYTNQGTIKDPAQNGIYMETNKDFWLASPSAISADNLPIVGGSTARVFRQYFYTTYGVRPIVSLKSDVPIKIEL